MRRVAIVGSRSYPKLDQVRRYVAALPADAVVITGGAKGVDEIAASVAAKLFLQVEVYKADWKTHGKKAGPIRNAFIASVCTELVAFWDGKSRGTADVIRKAKGRAGVIVTVFTVPA